MREYSIETIPADGIGPEVVAAGRALSWHQTHSRAMIVMRLPGHRGSRHHRANTNINDIRAILMSGS
jgi:isocitrate/isopropylmalate dehydrogenase